MNKARLTLVSVYVASLAIFFSTGPGARSVMAADVPTSNQPSVQDRLASARSAIKAQEWTRALFDLNQAVQEDPRNADVHNLLGYAYRKRASPDLAKAFEHYKLALRLDPKHMGAHEYIGEAYLMDKKPVEAEKHLTQLATICGNKTCEAYVDLARAISAYKAKN